MKMLPTCTFHLIDVIIALYLTVGIGEMIPLFKTRRKEFLTYVVPQFCMSFVNLIQDRVDTLIVVEVDEVTFLKKTLDKFLCELQCNKQIFILPFPRKLNYWKNFSVNYVEGTRILDFMKKSLLFVMPSGVTWKMCIRGFNLQKNVNISQLLYYTMRSHSIWDLHTHLPCLLDA